MRDTEQNEEMTYEKILTKLGQILSERETEYGDARQSHESVAARWSAVLPVDEQAFTSTPFER